MKNKEKPQAWEFWKNYGFTVLVVVFTLGVLAFFYFQKPNFTIYKEECRNETITTEVSNERIILSNITYYCWYGYEDRLDEYATFYDLETLKILEECSWMEVKNEPFTIPNITYFKYNKTICEKVEVDEIEICFSETWDLIDCEDIPFKAISKKVYDKETHEEIHKSYLLCGGRNEEYSCEMFYSRVLFPTCDKNWLEENCCCMTVHFEGKYEEDYYNLSLSSCYKNQTWKNKWGKKVYECIQYKCEFDKTYFVEVK